MRERAVRITEARKKTFLIDERKAPVSVCAYCRVSTDKNDQKNSFEVQKAFFEREFQRRDNWVGRTVFADRGISGTSLDKRDEFCRMIELAREHRFDLILTKEVSRFSRNVKDLLNLVTELHREGIYIWFLTDDIYTESEDYREALIKAGEQAEAESRRTSRRVRWGQKRQMENGVVFGAAALYGYRIRRNSNGEQVFEVVPEEAETVHRIFSLYADGMGTTRIARLLEAEGVRTMGGKARFTDTTLLRLLRNEKYVGDLELGKSYTPDFLTHRRAVNRGESAKVYIENSHPESAVIDRELWERVQMRLPQVGSTRHSRRFWCSGKLFCGECGEVFISSLRKRKSGESYRLWRCHAVHKGNGGIHAEGLNDKILQKAVRAAVTPFLSPALDRLSERVCGIVCDRERQDKILSLLRFPDDRALETVCGEVIEKIELRRGHLLCIFLVGKEEPVMLRYAAKGRGASFDADLTAVT